MKLTDLATEMLLPKSLIKQRAEIVTFYAPEVFAGVFDDKCDVWSTGVLMYMLLCGESPFFGITLQ
jgi:calcium-dependent protein kinase